MCRTRWHPVSPQRPLGRTQRAPGRRLAALQAESAQSPNSTELGQILITGFERSAGQFERIEGQFERIEGQFANVFEQLQLNREQLQQNREHADATFDQLGSDVSEVRQQWAANGTVLGADNEDRIADSLSPTFGADAVRGATLRSGIDIIQRLQQPIIDCGLSENMAADQLVRGICEVVASDHCKTHCGIVYTACLLAARCFDRLNHSTAPAFAKASKLHALPLQDQWLLRDALATMVSFIRDQLSKMVENRTVAAHCVQSALRALDGVIAASMSSHTTLHSLAQVSQAVAVMVLAVGCTVNNLGLLQWQTCIHTPAPRTDLLTAAVCCLA